MNSSPSLLLSGQKLSLEEVQGVACGLRKVELNPSSVQRVDASRQTINSILKKEVAVYGVNTGFGKLSDVRIPADRLCDLQVNLVRSHASGLGKPLSNAEVRAMLLLRANVLAKGFSGVRKETIEMLIALLNAAFIPSCRKRALWARAAILRRWLISRWFSLEKERLFIAENAWAAAKRCVLPGWLRYGLKQKKALLS